MTAIPESRQARQAIAIGLAVAFALAPTGIHSKIAAAEPTARASRTATVSIDRFAYQPATLTIGAGSKVVFSNDDGVRHTATRKGSFTTGRIKPGNSASIRFNRRGAFAYHCMIHPFMKGKIVVQ